MISLINKEIEIHTSFWNDCKSAVFVFLRIILFSTILSDLHELSQQRPPIILRIIFYLVIVAHLFVSSPNYFSDVLWNNCQQCSILSCQSSFNGEDEFRQDETGEDLRTWDDALRNSTQEFQHRSYNLLTCNCHSFVANNLNRLGFLSGGWNVVNLATLILFNGSWVSIGAMMKSFVPFVLVFFLGITFGGFTFLTYWFFFTFALIGWFLLGTYCFNKWIYL